MKQHITIKQLNELSEKAAEKYYDFSIDFEDKADGPYGKLKAIGCDTILLSIGQMIEFLGGNINIYYRIKEITSWVININENTYFKGELCDALWEAVKEVLET